MKKKVAPIITIILFIAAIPVLLRWQDSTDADGAVEPKAVAENQVPAPSLSLPDVALNDGSGTVEPEAATKKKAPAPSLSHPKTASDKSADGKESNVPYKYTKNIEGRAPAFKSNINPKAASDIKSILDALQNGYGKTPEIRNLNSPQVRSVIEALKTNKFPERLSVAITPAPFDSQKFESNKSYKKKYLNTVEPGRVRQMAQPNKKVPRLKRVSPYYQEVFWGKKVELKVKAKAGMPVTFSSLDLGQFSNTLTSETVVADSEGFATVHFHGVQGTIADTNILCSCPVTSGQLKFIVNTKKGTVQ